MKNVLLLTASAAALTISAPAMAQNVSDLDQNGTGNDAVNLICFEFC